MVTGGIDVGGHRAAGRGDRGDVTAAQRIPRARVARWVLLAADSSAIRQWRPSGSQRSLPIRCVIEVDDASDRVELPDQSSASVHWRTRGADTAPGSILLSALRDGLAAGPGYCWVAGEASAIRQARTYLVADGRLDRHSVVTRGYWRLGAVNHPD